MTTITSIPQDNMPDIASFLGFEKACLLRGVSPDWNKAVSVNEMDFIKANPDTFIGRIYAEVVKDIKYLSNQGWDATVFQDVSQKAKTKDDIIVQEVALRARKYLKDSKYLIRQLITPKKMVFAEMNRAAQEIAKAKVAIFNKFFRLLAEQYNEMDNIEGQSDALDLCYSCKEDPPVERYKKYKAWLGENLATIKSLRFSFRELKYYPPEILLFDAITITEVLEKAVRTGHLDTVTACIASPLYKTAVPYHKREAMLWCAEGKSYKTITERLKANPVNWPALPQECRVLFKLALAGLVAAAIAAVVFAFGVLTWHALVIALVIAFLISLATSLIASGLYSIEFS